MYSYIYIIYVVRRSFEENDRYDDITKNYWFTIYNPEKITIYDGITNTAIKQESDPSTGEAYVKLLPFTHYKYQNEEATITLDQFCQYGTLVPPINPTKFRIMFEHSILNPGIGHNNTDELRKDLLDGIKQLIEHQNKKWEERFGVNDSSIPTSKDVEKAIDDINSQTRTIIPLINASNAELKDLNIQVNQLTEIIKNTGFDKFRDEIADKIFNDPRAADTINQLLKKFDEQTKKIDEQNGLIIKIVHWLKACKWIVGTIVIVALVLGGLLTYLHYGNNIPPFMLGLADLCGNKDAAYNNAVLLEREKKYPEAANWYMKARKQYANLLEDNPNDSIRASRLAEMSMRGKGGIIDSDTAEYYAHLAKRYDLEAYLALINGNIFRAKDLVNNYQGAKSSYLELADALSTLLYPKELSAKEINSSWSVIDSLSSTINPATQEAINYAIALCDRGIQDKSGNYILIPSLYDAIAYATDADIHFNSVHGQIYLASRFESMNLRQEAEMYHAKATANNVFGHGEITFTHDRINGLTNDPEALVARAHNNAQKGYTDYRMTGYYYHIADSINKAQGIYKTGIRFYVDWLNFVVDAEDIREVHQILPLINKEYSDSLRIGIAEYVMALKYANGKGVSLDPEKSGEFLKNAASRGLEDAQVAIGILWDIDSIADGIKILEGLAFRESSKIHPWAARYILSKYYKQGEIIPELLKRSRDEFALLIKLNAHDLGQYNPEDLVYLRQQINIILSEKTDFFDSAFLLGKLAEIEYLMGHKDKGDFYITLADKISPKDAYSSYFRISEIARKSGDRSNATFFAGKFAALYFLDNGKTRYEPEKYNIITHYYHLYPEILDMIKRDKNLNYINDSFILHEIGFDWERDFSTYESGVKELPTELPDYERPAFPVTLKYFD